MTDQPLERPVSATGASAEPHPADPASATTTLVLEAPAPVMLVTPTQQSTDVNTQPASSTVNIAKLQRASEDTHATMDEIDTQL